MIRMRSVLVGGVLVVAVGPGLSHEASGQTIERVPARRIQSVQGVDTFQAYCAVCHGREAKGNGPAAPALKTVPADLTTIAKRKGKFSPNDMERWILGLDETPAHGSREMPIWGPVFRGVSTDDAEMKLRVANLIEYLKTLQAQ